MMYEFLEPVEVDSRRMQGLFALEPTPIDVAVRRTVGGTGNVPHGRRATFEGGIPERCSDPAPEGHSARNKIFHYMPLEDRRASLTGQPIPHSRFREEDTRRGGIPLDLLP